MMAARLLKRKAPESETKTRVSWFERALKRSMDATVNAYSRSLNWALAHGRFMMLLLAATVGFNFYLYGVIPKGFFPQQDTGMMLGFFSTDDGTSFD